MEEYTEKLRRKSAKKISATTYIAVAKDDVQFRNIKQEHIEHVLNNREIKYLRQNYPEERLTWIPAIAGYVVEREFLPNC